MSPDRDVKDHKQPANETWEFHQNISMSKNLEKNSILPGGYAIGNELISLSFGPCHAVIAKLNDNQFALYHASAPHATTDLDAFVQSVKGKVVDIYVFQKPPRKNPIKEFTAATYIHRERAAYLAITLALHLDIPVKRINVPGNYRSVVITENSDNKKSEVILADKITYLNDENNSLIWPEAGIPLDLAKFINMHDSIIDALNFKVKNHFSNLFIPQTMLDQYLSKDEQQRYETVISAMHEAKSIHDQRVALMNQGYSKYTEHILRDDSKSSMEPSVSDKKENPQPLFGNALEITKLQNEAMAYLLHEIYKICKQTGEVADQFKQQLGVILPQMPNVNAQNEEAWLKQMKPLTTQEMGAVKDICDRLLANMQPSKDRVYLAMKKYNAGVFLYKTLLKPVANDALFEIKEYLQNNKDAKILTTTSNFITWNTPKGETLQNHILDAAKHIRKK